MRESESSSETPMGHGWFLLVDGACDGERFPLRQPAEHQLQELCEAMTLMVACNGVVQPPPHPLHGVALRRILGQEVQLDPVAVLVQELTDLPAAVELGVVADDVDLSVAAQAVAQLAQVPREQGPIALGPLRG